MDPVKHFTLEIIQLLKITEYNFINVIKAVMISNQEKKPLD